MRDKRILMGILFIFAGIGLVINKLGYFSQVNIFSLLATFYMVYIITRSIGKKNIFGILIPLALIGVIYWDYFGVSFFNPWTLVWAAVLISIGISIIFKPKTRHGIYGKFDYENKNAYEEVDGKVYIESIFSECIRYLQGKDLQKIRLENTFGSMKIYFDRIEVRDNHLTVDIEATFAGIELYIPKEWKIINNVDATFGAVNEKNRNTGEDTTTLILQGDVSFAGVEIIYI